jgi:hypothetical protein
VPILIAAGKPAAPLWPLFWRRYENDLFEASPDGLADLLGEIIQRIEHRGVDVAGWEQAPYRPVPTIVEAATMLYRKHDVSDIKEARAEAINLTRTTDRILAAIADARSGNKHIIIFVTGIPGAGKTLCGLNVVFSTDSSGAFLTGTLPMVYVLRQALAADASRHKTKSKDQAMREMKGKIQAMCRLNM